MLVIPAIDLKGGRCVRLRQGDPNQETVYSDDPISVARKFQEDGAKLIHVVDLDGAFEGRPVHGEIVRKIAASISIPIEIGGGIRTKAAVEGYVEAGISRVIIGTALLGDGFEEIFGAYRKYIIVGIDAKNSMVATHGWKEVSNIDAVSFIKDLHEKGVEEVIYTDISTDGMLSGPNVSAMERILRAAPGLSLIASGGVSSLDDVMCLKELAPLGLKGAIVGKAIYDGRINLKDAIQIAS